MMLTSQFILSIIRKSSH